MRGGIRRGIASTAARLGRNDRHTPRIRRPSARRRAPGRSRAGGRSAPRKGAWSERAKYGEIGRLLDTFTASASGGGGASALALGSEGADGLASLIGGDETDLFASTHPTAPLAALREIDTDAMVVESIAWDDAALALERDGAEEEEEAPPSAADRFNVLIAAQGAQGRHAAALRSWERMRLLGVAPNEGTYRNLVMACARSGALDEARRIFALQCSEAPERAPSAPTCAALVYAHVVADDLAGAVATIEALHESNARLSAHAYNSVLAASARAGDMDATLALLETMRWHAVAPDACTFAALIHACAKTGEVERAMNFHDEMVQVRARSARHAACVRVRGRAHPRGTPRTPRCCVDTVHPAPLRKAQTKWSFIYRYISRESCSQFDSLPLTSLTIPLTPRSPLRLSPPLPSERRRRCRAKCDRT